jgi:hypothetical protein
MASPSVACRTGGGLSPIVCVYFGFNHPGADLRTLLEQRLLKITLLDVFVSVWAGLSRPVVIGLFVNKYRINYVIEASDGASFEV